VHYLETWQLENPIFKVENLGKEPPPPRSAVRATVDEAHPLPGSQPTPGAMKLDYRTSIFLFVADTEL
jgi:hypothetical protein